MDQSVPGLSRMPLTFEMLRERPAPSRTEGEDHHVMCVQKRRGGVSSAGGACGGQSAHQRIRAPAV